MAAVTLALATNPGGYLLVLAIIVPVVGMIASLVAGGRAAERIALIVMPAGIGIALAIVAGVWWEQTPLVYILGGWAPPLGIALRADGFSAVMLLAAALIVTAAAHFARPLFATPPELAEGRAPLAFWTLLQGLWAALNMVFVGGDLFNLYVALELLTFAAVPLVCLDGRPETLRAALRYLLFALIGSVFYLLGVALLYGAYGTLDIVLLAQRIRESVVAPATLVAGGLMTAGLLAKTALFPLHLWLPPAHANAPAPASAVLSALVVKGSFFLIVRLWFDVMPGLASDAAMGLLGALGSGAILFGSVLALRQRRLKLLIAYSTIAQIGYLFLMFPLAAGSEPWNGQAWNGGVMQALSHAFAKAAMFMAAGLVAESLGHDRIADLRGIGRAMPVTLFAFGLGGLSLMGLPPSGGFTAKWLLLQATVHSGQWLWAVIVVGGGLLAGGYVYRVVAPALAVSDIVVKAHPSRRREAVVLTLAIAALLLGLVPPRLLDLLQVGRQVILP
jgi:formate hydrogenlyase subunit 3/multisubunit Na+/H+ antiporter MnhD subunit